jgi:hypothetical protein
MQLHALKLDALLLHPIGVTFLARHLEVEYSIEHLYFLLECQVGSITLGNINHYLPCLYYRTLTLVFAYALYSIHFFSSSCRYVLPLPTHTHTNTHTHQAFLLACRRMHAEAVKSAAVAAAAAVKANIARKASPVRTQRKSPRRSNTNTNTITVHANKPGSTSPRLSAARSSSPPGSPTEASPKVTPQARRQTSPMRGSGGPSMRGSGGHGGKRGSTERDGGNGNGNNNGNGNGGNGGVGGGGNGGFGGNGGGGGKKSPARVSMPPLKLPPTPLHTLPPPPLVSVAVAQRYRMLLSMSSFFESHFYDSTHYDPLLTYRAKSADIFASSSASASSTRKPSTVRSVSGTATATVAPTVGSECSCDLYFGFLHFAYANLTLDTLQLRFHNVNNNNNTKNSNNNLTINMHLRSYRVRELSHTRRPTEIHRRRW